MDVFFVVDLWVIDSCLLLFLPVKRISLPPKATESLGSVSRLARKTLVKIVPRDREMLIGNISKEPPSKTGGSLSLACPLQCSQRTRATASFYVLYWYGFGSAQEASKG